MFALNRHSDLTAWSWKFGHRGIFRSPRGYPGGGTTSVEAVTSLAALVEDISVLFSLDEAPFFPSRRVSSGISNMAGLTSAADLIGQLFKGDFHVFGPPGSNPWAAVDPRAFRGDLSVLFWLCSAMIASIFLDYRKNILRVKIRRVYAAEIVTRL